MHCASLLYIGVDIHCHVVGNCASISLFRTHHQGGMRCTITSYRLNFSMVLVCWLRTLMLDIIRWWHYAEPITIESVLVTIVVVFLNRAISEVLFEYYSILHVVHST